MTRIKTTDRLDALEVLGLADEEAARWLKDHRFSDRSWHAKRESRWHPIASFAFARRGSKHLRIAVARYGTHVITLRQLFVGGTSSERLAVLANPLSGPSCFGGSNSAALTTNEATNVLGNYGKRIREVEVLACNPKLDPYWLTATIKSWNSIDGFDEEGLLTLLRVLPENKMLIAERENLDLSERPPLYAHNFDKDHSYEELNKVLANFLVTAPVKSTWASVLSRLLRIVLIPLEEEFDFGLLDRWTDPEPDEEEGEDYSFVMLRRDIAQGLIDRDNRMRVDRCYPVKHPDADVRACFYRSLPPEKLFGGIPLDASALSFLYGDSNLSDAQKVVRDLCRDYLAMDKDRFIDCLNDNMHFWQTKDMRQFLRDIDSPNLHATSAYLTQRKYHLERSPELFNDEECVDESVESRLTKIEETLSAIRRDIHLQSPVSLTTEQTETLDELVMRRIEDQSDQLVFEVRANTEEVLERVARGTRLQLTRQTVSMVLIVVGLGVIGYLILR